jgi:hypothetical protein
MPSFPSDQSDEWEMPAEDEDIAEGDDGLAVASSDPDDCESE